MSKSDIPRIKRLLLGETIKFKSKGSSMTPLINPGDMKTIAPITDYSALKIGDIVYCTIGNSTFTHLITEIHEDKWQISNNHGKINGWIDKNQIHGICIKVEKL